MNAPRRVDGFDGEGIAFLVAAVRFRGELDDGVPGRDLCQRGMGRVTEEKRTEGS